MKSNSLIALVVGIVAIAAVIYLVTAHDKTDEPTTALGHVVQGVGDKLDQASYEMKADSSENSASSNFDAAKKDLGIETSDTTE
ncbi:MAG: hypothetical protein GC129_05105 [Proteobacteria bacterium]|nr:hypothetical protein [Pseudomonadota bacterium]